LIWYFAQINVGVAFVVEGRLNKSTFSEVIEKNVLQRIGRNGKPEFSELRQYFYSWRDFTFWKKDPKFHIGNHVFENTSRLTENEFPGITGQVFAEKWAPKRSPWKFIVFPNYVKAGNPLSLSIVIFCAHHGLGDGEGLFKTFFKFIFDEPVETSVAELPPGMLSKGPSPVFPFDIIRDYFRSYDVNAFHSAKLKISKERQVWFHPETIPLKPIDEIKFKLNVSRTAVMLSAIGGGIRKYMELNGFQPPEHLHLLNPIFLPRKKNGPTNNR
jgi:hypothetical protein